MYPKYEYQYRFPADFKADVTSVQPFNLPLQASNKKTICEK